ncbi:MAG: flagellar protein FlaG [Burkholderiales bacterium]|nr:flagellar protein FlaG [Burkholderiales bacterium]
MTPLLARSAVQVVAPDPPSATARANSRATGATGSTREAIESEHDVPAAVEAANRAMALESTRLRFDIDMSQERMIVRIVDGETGQILRQLPSEEMLALARRLDRLQGLLLRERA